MNSGRIRLSQKNMIEVSSRLTLYLNDENKNGTGWRRYNGGCVATCLEFKMYPILSMRVSGLRLGNILN